MLCWILWCGGRLGFLVMLIQIVTQDPVDRCGQGDTQQHAGDTEDTAADGNGSKDPQPRQTDGRADHTGVNDIAFQLLQDKNKDQEDQCLQRGFH